MTESNTEQTKNEQENTEPQTTEPETTESASAEALPSTDEHDVPTWVQLLLERAAEQRASDVHIEPTASGFIVRFRIDGVLEVRDQIDEEMGEAVIARLLVMADLQSYISDRPQEGRIEVPLGEAGDRPMPVRLSVMPISHGTRATLRMPAELTQPRELDNLGLPEPVVDLLLDFASGDSGMMLVTGPAGSGKTTTLYSLLEHMAQNQPGLSIVSMEDPVERDLTGVTQIEVSPFSEMTYESTLRTVLRQDPQVLMLGEIRDAETAHLALHAALSGHRLVSTMHADDPATAIARLIEMELEPYQIASVLTSVVSMRLLRRTTEEGYQGRAPIAESVRITEPIRKMIMEREDAPTIRQYLRDQEQYQTFEEVGRALVDEGVTDDEELQRVLPSRPTDPA